MLNRNAMTIAHTENNAARFHDLTWIFARSRFFSFKT